MAGNAGMTDDQKKLLAAHCAALREGEVPVEYPPFLREPIYRDPDRMPLQPSGNVHGFAEKAASERRQKYADKIQAEIDAKWRWLFATYGINDDPKKNPNWAVELLMALVNQHVPGFRITSELPAPPKARKQRGGQRKYHVYDDAYLVWLVDHVRREMAAKKGGAEVTKDAAIKRALKEGHFGKLALKPDGQKMSAESWIPRYYEAETRWKSAFFNREILAGKHHTPQSLAREYLDAVKRAGENTTDNPDHSS